MRKTKIDFSVEEARNFIESIYPDPHGRPIYDSYQINKEIDLSIIVPVYNYADLLERNIKSIIGQNTKYKFELILVDDGSTDGSLNVMIKYQKLPFVKVISQENLGIAGARNTGIDNAYGKYIMFVDCDDTIHEDMVETLLDEAFNKDCDIVMCAHNLSKERNGHIYSIIPNVYSQRNLMGYNDADTILNYAGLPWGKVYKHELWERVRFFPGYWYEDSIIHFLVFTQCKRFSYIPKILYNYRWYERNFSHVQGRNTITKVIDRYWLLNAMIEQYTAMGLPIDNTFYTVLLKHVSAFYYPQISLLDEKTVEALFLLASNLVEKYHPKKDCQLPFVLKITEKALLTKDIELWKLASMYQ